MRVKLKNSFWDGAVMHSAGEEVELPEGVKAPRSAKEVKVTEAVADPELPLEAEAPKKGSGKIDL